MAVKIQNLSFRYANSPASVLSGLNLDVKNGECAAITGLNGSGKSTLVLALSGLLPEYKAGEISGEISGASAGARVLENVDSQILCETVESEISFFARHSCSGPKKTPAEIADNLGIGELLFRRTHTLSSGEKQRLALACGIFCSGSGLAVLDEPAAWLDDEGADKLLGILSGLKESGAAVIIAGRRLERLSPAIDAYYLLNEGKLSACAEPEESAPPVFCGADGEVFLKAENLAFRPPDGEAVFSGFGISLRRGEICGLAGPNGSGKTAVSEILAGIKTSPEGGVFLGGKAASASELRRKARLVGQNPFNQLIYQTVRQNFEAARAPSETLAGFLSPILNKDVSELSFSQAQRAALACALASAPELLILDETLSVMDGEAVSSSAKLISDFARAGGCILLVSHLENLVKSACGRIFRLEGNCACAK